MAETLRDKVAKALHAADEHEDAPLRWDLTRWSRAFYLVDADATIAAVRAWDAETEALLAVLGIAEWREPPAEPPYPAQFATNA